MTHVYKGKVMWAPFSEKARVFCPSCLWAVVGTFRVVALRAAQALGSADGKEICI